MRSMLRMGVAALAIASAASLSAPKRGFEKTSAATKGLVSGLTALVNAAGGRAAATAPRLRAFPEGLSPEAVLAGLEVDFAADYLWTGAVTPELYDERCVFTDPTLSFAGLDTFERNIANLEPWLDRLVGAKRVDLESIALREDRGAVLASWRMVGDINAPWRPRLDLRGTTTFTLGGAGGRISAYDETWSTTAADALASLLRPAAPDSEKAVPEFWPGREGGARPAPAVVLGDGAPTFLVLPGFGNDAGDYVEPLGLGRECGLAAALERRNCKVRVVPVRRRDWLAVFTRGLFDLPFLLNRASLDSPAFAWYTREVADAVDKIEDGDVVLVGHSAGGWLARLYAASYPDQYAARVAGVVTLGAPLEPPPEGVDCATRGVLAAAAALPTPPGFLVCVGSDAVTGDPDAAGTPEAIASDAYRRTIGDPAAVGDGVVPLASSASGDADVALTLGCLHSVNVAGTTDPTDDWYGAERNVDAWLAPVRDQLAAEKRRFVRSL